MIHCARCGEELTKPYPYKSKPYGWTCITIVDLTAKKTTKKFSILSLPIEDCKIQHRGPNWTVVIYKNNIYDHPMITDTQVHVRIYDK